MPHYNTTDLDPKTLQRLNELSVSQEEKIYQLFRLLKRPMAWFEVKVYFPNMNESALKRSLSALKGVDKYGNTIKNRIPKLEKTTKKVDHYGVSCYQYALKMNY